MIQLDILSTVSAEGIHVDIWLRLADVDSWEKELDA